jgi:molybdate/tungstate transport system substrate-binding protein
MMKHLLYFTLFSGVIFGGCRHGVVKKRDIIIFHAGSLSVPIREVALDYEKKHPDIRILLEPAGSIVCARKVTELKKPCDIIASADYFVINELLIPDYASWGVRFATNEIVIAFQEKSRFSSQINSDNWMNLLLRDDVTFARSDPDNDPCGYRSVMLLKLADRYYNKPRLSEKFLAKNRDFIRPKEVDLVALLESNAVDYMFQYKSVAIQHNLKYISLPSEINLGDPSKSDLYKTVSVDVTGNTPGSRMTVTGDFINYSLTVLDNAVNKKDAIDFVSFLLSNSGMEIFRKNGQNPITPFLAERPDNLPIELRKYFATR